MPERLRAWTSGLARAAGLHRAPALLLRADGVWDGGRAHASFADWCQSHPGQRCALWISAAFSHDLVCPADTPIADDTAACEWATALLQQYHGEAAAAWPLAAWQQGRRRGVSALHGVTLQALGAAAAAHGVRLASMRPWWSGVLRRAASRHAALNQGVARLLVLEGGRMVVVDLDAGAVQALSVRRLDAAEPAALSSWLQEQAPRSTVAVGYGLAQGAERLTDVALLSPLDGDGPAPAWLNGAGA